MSIEVEQKFRNPDLELLRGRLRELAAQPHETVCQVDTYFAHPVRDFEVTDEAFRIRQAGPRNWITYKGPKLDSATKTRREFEIPFADGAATVSDLISIWMALGFKQVAKVKKQREPFVVSIDGTAVECVIDHVDHLGTFAELEIVTVESQVDVAKNQLFAAAAALGLPAGSVERRSYLEMLLARSAPGTDADP